MKVFERIIKYDCDNHNLHKRDIVQHPKRKNLNPKTYFGIGAVIERDDQLMHDEFGCEDFTRTLSDIKEVEQKS